MCLLCRLPVAKNHNFWRILAWGILYRPPFTDEGQIWCARADPRSIHLQAKFHLNVFVVSASGGPKPQFWANFDIFGLLYRPPFTDEGQMWCAIADPRYALICQISSRSFYSVALCWRKPPIFAVFGLRHLVLSPIGNSLTKLNTDAQLQTFPYLAHNL